MGYCMSLEQAKFCIKKRNKLKALYAVKALKNGSWVDDGALYETKTLEGAMHAWRYVITEDDKHNVDAIVFVGEKFGDDERLFKTLAPYIENGSFLEFHGEDGHMWRYVFKNGVMTDQTAKISWES